MIKKEIQIVVIIFLLLCCFACKKKSTEPPPVDTRDILEKLEAMEEIEVEEIETQNGYPRQFKIDIVQPVDHNNPDGVKFAQRIYLSHLDESLPVIFMPSGYAARAYTQCELSLVMEANQMQVTHRYMQGARPDLLDWDYLTIEQAAADHHRIVQLFKQLYKGKWVSYGRSKNGETALFHRRFYPQDVLATVALVAPLSLGIEDPRYEDFLEYEVGDDICRTKIKQYQRRLLENRDEIIPMIEAYMRNASWSYSLTADIILDYEACEYYFAFWQITEGDCSTIPDEEATVQELYQYLEDFGGFPLYSDEYIDFYQPVYYQFYTEQGYYRLINDHLESLLLGVPEPSYSFFAPKNVDLVFNQDVIPDVINWLQMEGNNIIYVYGGQDPWTAGAISSTGGTNAIKIIEPGVNHYILISGLSDAGTVYATLSAWLDVEIGEGVGLASASAAISDGNYFFRHLYHFE
jgi:hypothetical protein